jgi:ABC-2 type transport system ATP-binding protein
VLRQQIGISLQETRLSEKLTVRETVRLFRGFYRQGLSPDDALALVSLQDKAAALVGKLSGGQKQRLSIACAMAGDPQLLFLDEPTTGLDPQSRRQLWEIIRRFKEQGRTVLLTTHYMDEAERLCDRVAIVDFGQVIALGSPQQLIASLGGEHIIELKLDEESPHAEIRDEQLADVPSVRSVTRENGSLVLSVAEPHVALPALIERLGTLGGRLSQLTTRHASLEDVFVKLAGRHLDDEQSNA